MFDYKKGWFQYEKQNEGGYWAYEKVFATLKFCIIILK